MTSVKEVKICPACGKEYTECPAISRQDNKTEICPKCGMLEGVSAFIQGNYTGDLSDCRYYCIFEKTLCIFAKREGNTFRCIAPSDTSMSCNKK